MPLHKRGPVDSICMAISPLMCEGTYAELTSQCPVRCRSISLRLTSSTHRAFNTRRSFASEPHSSKTSNVPAAKTFIYILERAHRSNKSKYHENNGRLRLNVAHAARVGAGCGTGRLEFTLLRLAGTAYWIFYRVSGRYRPIATLTRP